MQKVRHPHRSDGGPYAEFYTWFAETLDGIGARDFDLIDLTDVTECDPDGEPRAPFYEAGPLYAEARKGANEMRRRAFPALEGLFTSCPEQPVRFGHLYGAHTPQPRQADNAWPEEFNRGIPAW